MVLSLLDWRTKENRANYQQHEQLLNVRIHTVALLEGEIEVSGSSLNERREQGEQRNLEVESDIAKDFCVSVEQKLLNLKDIISFYSLDSNGNPSLAPYLGLTGRFGLSSEREQEILPLAKGIGEKLKLDRSGEKTLCLGTGEFMYFPMLISAYMGDGIKYHSSTRSPIYPFAKPDYGIQNRFSFTSPDDEDLNFYVYNIPPNYYDEVYVFLEREVSSARLKPLLQVFAELKMPRLVFVIGSSIETPEDKV